MPVSTRKSLAPASDENGQSSQQEVTAIMNDLASNIPPTPSRKRPRHSDFSDIPIGRPKKVSMMEVPHLASVNSTPGVPSPRRASGRLKARASLPAQPTASKRINWELEDDTGANVRGAEPVKKLIPLAKRKAPEMSPFKGKGTLQTESSARVNLDDSPTKPSKRSGLTKITKSLQKSARPAKRKLTRVKKTTNKSTLNPGRSGGPSTLVGDPFEDAQMEEDEPMTPGLSLRDQHPREWSPLKADRRPGRKAATGGPQQIPPSGQGETTALNHELSQPVQKKKNNIAPKLMPAQKNGVPDDQDEAEAEETIEVSNGNEEETGEIVEEPEINEDEAEGTTAGPLGKATQDQDEEYTTYDVPPASPLPRPDTEAEQRERQIAEAETEEKHRRARRKALRGIEDALEYSDLTEPWVGLLVGTAKIAEVRSTAKEESIRGKGVRRAINRLKLAYSELQTQNTSSAMTLRQKIGEDMKVLKQRCAHIDGYKAPKDSSESGHLSVRERGKTIRDVYQHLIPGVVMLARRVLKTLFIGDDLSFDAHKELVRVLKIVDSLFQTARSWQPRPQLESGIKSLTIDSLAVNLDSIISKYEDVIDIEGSRIHRKKFTLEQIADREWLLAEQKRKNACYRQPENYERAVYRRERRPRPQHVVDIDDFSDLDDLNGVHSTDFAQPTGGHGQTSMSTTFDKALPQQQRPMVRRQATEEIPAPTQDTWTNGEIVVLLEALQQFQGPNRFEDIVELHGGPDGILKNFDMDQIMTQARYVKESMAKLLATKSPSDPEWSWLITCP